MRPRPRQLRKSAFTVSLVVAMLYGGDSFQAAMRIANTAGWDTDCNASNVGCLFGIRKGLAGNLMPGRTFGGPSVRTGNPYLHR